MPETKTDPRFCPFYPEPKRNKLAWLSMFFSARNSWLDALYHQSYRMQMGEVRLPGLDLFMVNDPKLVRQVLDVKAGDFPKSPLLHQALFPLLGESIFTTNAHQWRKQRAMMNPAFAQARLDFAFPAMLNATRDMLGRLEKNPASHALDLEEEMTHVTADIIFRTIFSIPIEEKNAREMFSAFARFQALAPRLMLPSIFGMKWLVWPWDRWQSIRAAKKIRTLLGQMISARMSSLADRSFMPPQDILQSFIDAKDDTSGAVFSKEALIDQVAMLFLAGHETSASALSWATYMLAHSPHIQDRMHQEICAAAKNREFQVGDMRDLPLTRNVFRETLRLYPPVGFFVREASQDCVMRDKVVKAGSNVVVSPWLIQRHRKLWKAPDFFNPDRFDEQKSRTSVRDAYLPFGMGPRVCLGAAFALQEATLILASLIRDYRLLPLADHTPYPVGRLTIRSANGIRLQLVRRNKDEA
jgi:cytochrome P450